MGRSAMFVRAPLLCQRAFVTSSYFRPPLQEGGTKGHLKKRLNQRKEARGSTVFFFKERR